MLALVLVVIQVILECNREVRGFSNKPYKQRYRCPRPLLY